MPLDEADTIWGEMPALVNEWSLGGREVECARSGHYRVTGSVLQQVRDLPPAAKAKLTTLIIDSNRVGEVFEIGSWTLDQLEHARSLGVAERMDRFLAYFVHRDFGPSTRITWLLPHTQSAETIRSLQQAAAWIEAQSVNDVPPFGQLLDDVGYVESTNNYVRITPAGFARMDELRRGGAPTNRVFVAMWFNEETADSYENGIAAAISETGFEPIRIDKKEHINKIDDEIVAEIKRSRFVVADFTCGSVKTQDGDVLVPRGGVYYEAGLAQGREIPVIWCVRHDQIERVHFDTRQFNHIVWTDAEDFKTKLRNRIRALFADAR